MIQRRWRAGSRLILLFWCGIICISSFASDVPGSMSARYPGSVNGILSDARLETLTEGELLRAGDVVVTVATLEEYRAKLSEKMRSDKNGALLDMLESLAFEKVMLPRIVKDSGKEMPTEDELRELYQQYFQKEVGKIEISDEEARAFYDKNQDRIGGHPFESVKGAIKSNLTQEKAQDAWNDHVRKVGGDIPIRLQASWVDQQVKSFQESPIEKARTGGKPVLADFSATWCGPCKRLKPTLEALEKKYADRVTFVILDVDEHPNLARRYGASSVPLLLFYDKDGKEAGRSMGLMSEEAIIEKFKALGVE